MIANFEQDGIRFRYPGSWKLEREDTDCGWTVSLYGPGTAFLLLSYDADMPQPDDMVRTALEAMREEYPDLEADPCVDSVAGQPACGHDIRFFSFDLTNTCWTRSFYSARGTVLILWQVNDLELEASEAILRAICASLEVGED